MSGLDLGHHATQAERYVRQGATKWTLVHVCQLTGRETLVLTEAAPAAAECADFVAGIAAHLDDEAAVYAGPQVYHLRWTDGTRQIGRQLFRLDGRLLDGPGTGHYPPTHEGVTALALQHAERKDRALLLAVGQVVSGMEQVTKSLIEENRRQSAQIATLTEYRFKAMDAVEDARDRSAERLERIERAKTDRETSRALLGLAGKVAPELAARFLGAAPALAAPVAPKLDAFIDSLSDEQLDGLRASLSPEQQVLVLELIEDRAARRAAEADTTTTAPAAPN